MNFWDWAAVATVSAILYLAFCVKFHWTSERRLPSA